MPAKLPYVLSPSAVKNALERMRSAATPPKFTTDFVNTVLLVKGGTGDTITPFMKRIGFVASDGTPTDLYKRFRNPVTGGTAVAEAIKVGYKELSAANEYFFKLPDKELKALVVQVTGLDHDNRIVSSVVSTLNTLKSFADFDSEPALHAITTPTPTAAPERENSAQRFDEVASSRMGLNLAYTINLNLPATADQAVFNAIFKSLREHLLNNE